MRLGEAGQICGNIEFLQNFVSKLSGNFSEYKEGTTVYREICKFSGHGKFELAQGILFILSRE
jgi:hypothetical protein